MIQSLLDTVKEQVVFLNSLPDEETLCIKPASSDWTAAQCIQHMNLATELYLDQIEPKLSGLKPADKAYKPRTWRKSSSRDSGRIRKTGSGTK